jgi:ABC-type multidrug transport system fused ATPase/permease subunit
MKRFKIEKFAMWRIKQSSDLDFIFSKISNYFELEPKEPKLHGKSFKEAINIFAHELELKPIALSKVNFNVPIIAHDKKNDCVVLLLPNYEGYLVYSNNKKSFYIRNQEALDNFDEHILLFPKNFPISPKKPFVSNLWPIVIFTFLSVIFFILTFTEILAVITNTKPIYLVLASVISLWLFLSLSFIAKWLSTKDYAINLVNHIFQYYRSFLDLSYEIFIEEIPKLENKIKSIKKACFDYFFNRYFSIFVNFIILSSLLLFFWFPVLGFLIIISYALIFIFYFYLNLKEEKYKPKVSDTRANLALTLEQLGLVFQNLWELKAFDEFFKKIYRQKNISENFEKKLLIIKILQKSGRIYSPLLLFIAFALWQNFFLLELSLWFTAWLSFYMLFLGLAASVSAENLFKKPEIIEPWPLKPKAHVEPVNILGKFEIINMSFFYHDLSNLVFKNYSLSLKPENFYIISGPSGVGKSTLIKIFLGFLSPTSGQVIIDGQDLRSLNLSSLRSNFGVIFDDANLFMGSVYENIMCGRDLAPKYLEDLLLSNEIFDTLIDMPMGLNNFIFWHQKNLSSYEKALILLARALVHRPKVLLMDEFIDSLNLKEQEKIGDFLSNLSITRILVSNNPKIFKNTDEIFLKY